MDLSIIIVNWNTRELLAGCLSSVASSSVSIRSRADETLGPESEPAKTNQELLTLDRKGLATEVIVVDNASTDGSASMVQKRFPWVKLIANRENAGYAGANNQAIRQSESRYVLLLNSDTVVEADAVEMMVRFLDDHPGAAGCGPRLINADGSFQPSCHPMLTPHREFWRLMFLDRLWRRASYPQSMWTTRQPRPVEVIKGACLLLRQQALDEVGLLDERYFMYTEEMDLCYRLSHAGWELWWIPQSVVLHYGEASSQQMAEEMYIQLYQSKVQFHRKFGGERRAAYFRFLLFLAYAPRWLSTVLSRPIFAGLADRERTYRRLLTELIDM